MKSPRQLLNAERARTLKKAQDDGRLPQRFKVGDRVKTQAGWSGVVVRKHKCGHNGFVVRWTDTLSHLLTKPGDVSERISPRDLTKL